MPLYFYYLVLNARDKNLLYGISYLIMDLCNQYITVLILILCSSCFYVTNQNKKGVLTETL